MAALSAPDDRAPGFKYDPVTDGGVTALVSGIVVALLGVRIVVPADDAFVDPSQVLAGCIVIVVGVLVAQAGLVGFVVGGFRLVESRGAEQDPAVGRGDDDATVQ